VKIEVLVSQWSADDEVFPGGVHEIAKPTKSFLRLAASAEAEGSIKVSASKEERSSMSAHIESQGDSEVAYAEAQRDGRWHEGQYDQFAAEVEQGLKDQDALGPLPDKETYIAERTVS
jgi:hypothetical protein